MLPLGAVLTILAIKSTLVSAGTRPRNVRDITEKVDGVIPPKRTVAECWSDNYYNLYCDGNCIGLWSICDGITDCKNGEDETHAICHVPSYRMKPGEEVEVHLRNIKKMNGIFFMPCLKGSCGIIHVWGATRDGKLEGNVVTGARDMGPHTGYGDSLKMFRPANAEVFRDDLKIFVVRKTNGSLQVSLKGSPQFAIDFRHSGDKLQLRPWKWDSTLWKSWRVYGDIEDSQWFRCRNGELVNDDLKCNAANDCNDGSDEEKAMCEVYTNTRSLLDDEHVVIRVQDIWEGGHFDISLCNDSACSNLALHGYSQSGALWFAAWTQCHMWGWACKTEVNRSPFFRINFRTEVVENIIALKMKKSSSTRYFLVFFKHGRNGRPESDVLHQKRIPDGYGSAAKVNDRVRIKYKDDDTKKFTFYDGVILQIDHDLNVLQTIDVDEKGEIVPPNQKRFPEELLAVKRHLAKQSRAITVAAKEHQRTLDTSLLGISVFNTASAPGCSGNLPQNGGTASQLQSDSRLVTPAGCSKDLSVNDVTASLLPSVSHLVTPEVKVFLEALVPAASSLHDSSQCAQVDWLHSVLQNILRSLESEQEKNVTLPEHFLKQSKQCDTDLFGNGKFFVPFMSYRAIHADVENKKGKKKNSWQIYVSEVLNRLYGNRMLYLTAKGQRRTTGIDGDLYNSLLDYCLHHFENFRSLENRVPAFNRNINVIRQGRKNMSKNRTAARENGAVVAKKQSKGNKKQSKGNQKQSKGNQKQSKGNQKQSKGNQKQAKGKGSDSESDDEDEYEDISSESENHTGELRRTSSMDDEDLLDETPIREKLQQKCHGKRVVGENRQLLERKFLQPVLVGKRKISDGYLHSSTSEGPHIQSQATDFHQGFTKQMRPGQVISAAGQYNPYYQQAPHRVPHSYSHRGGSPVVSSGQGAQRLPHNYSPNQVSQLPAYYSHLPQEGSHVYDYAPTAGSPYVANSEGIQSVEQYSQDPMTIALQVVNNPNLI